MAYREEASVSPQTSGELEAFVNADDQFELYTEEMAAEDAELTEGVDIESLNQEEQD